ncbi:CU044_5270 family protein [Actinoplanes sp. NPDC049802]|uniref:CU044_5270 family protein n=1 Tax=Actinoplanes sp. NPDC049802 TaxID=3154742 RepID=UPI00340C8610
MNDTDIRAELATLLPRPGRPGMTPRRFQRRRAALVAAIDAPPVRRRGLILIALPAATVLAVTFAATIVARPWDSGEPPPIVRVLAGDHDEAVRFLNRLAAAAGSEPRPGVTEGRYLYVRSRVAFVRFSGDPVEAEMQELHDREIWKPLFLGGHGRLKEEGRPTDLGPARAVDLQPELPSDPQALLAKIYRESEGQGTSRDGQAFTVIGDLLHESLLAPEINAALYQAAARIPGVELVPDVVDAIGRHGVGVAREEEGIRREWIFDRASGEYLGERAYLVEDTSDGKAGMLMATTAVTGRAVVDRLGATS